MNMYQSKTYKKDLSWLHFDDKSRIREKQQVKDQQSCISVFVASLRISSSNEVRAPAMTWQQYSMYGSMVHLWRYRETSGERNFMEGIKVTIILEVVLTMEIMQQLQSNLEENVNPTILKDDFSSRIDPPIFTLIAPVLLDRSDETSWFFPAFFQWTNNGVLGNSSINWIFLWKFPIQNHPKIRGKAKYLTWNSIWRLKFVKKTSMPNPVKSLGYIKHYSSSSPRPDKSPRNSIKYNWQKICSWSRRPKTYWKSEKRSHFSRWSTILIVYKFFKDFANHRKKTNRVAVLSCKPFPNILKYRDHEWDLPTIWKTRLLQIYIEEFS